MQAPRATCSVTSINNNLNQPRLNSNQNLSLKTEPQASNYALRHAKRVTKTDTKPRDQTQVNLGDMIIFITILCKTTIYRLGGK